MEKKEYMTPEMIIKLFEQRQIWTGDASEVTDPGNIGGVWDDLD